MDKWGTHFLRILHKSKDVVAKHDNFVFSSFVIANQELASSKLVGIHNVDQDALPSFAIEILSIELRRHGAPNFCTLNPRQIAIVPQFHPICFI